MNLPQLVTAAELAKLAAPDEQLAIRVIFRRITNTGPYTIRGIRRRYLAVRDPGIGAHILEVPLSVWMAGVPAGPYADNLSIAHDLQANRPAVKAPLVLLVVPWKHAKPLVSGSADRATESGPVDALRRLAEVMAAPDLILSAIDLLGSDLPAAERESALLETLESVKEQIARAEAETLRAAPKKSNAERQREFRARRKAEKEAAKLEPATA